MKYDALIDELIFIKDELKHMGWNYKKLDCINKACNILEDLQRKED